MMSLRKFLMVGIAGSSLFAGGAVAADLPTRAPAPAPVIAVPLLAWDGFYIGGNVGYGFVHGDRVGVRTFPGGVFTPPAQGNVDSKGVFGGIQLGYNAQFNRVVAGVEVDAQLSGMSETSSGVAPLLLRTKADINWFGTLRGRLGFLVTPNVLIYGTAGGALTDVSYRWSVPAPVAPMSTTHQRVGWTAGGGIEVALNSNWSVKGEYLFVDTGRNRILNTARTFSTMESQSFHLVRLGVNYRISSMMAPVVAKY